MREAGHPTNRQGFDRGRGLADRIFPSFTQAFNSREKWDILRSPLSLCRRAGLSSSSLTPGSCKTLHSRLGCDVHIRLCGVPATAGITTRQKVSRHQSCSRTAHGGPPIDTGRVVLEKYLIPFLGISVSHEPCICG